MIRFRPLASVAISLLATSLCFSQGKPPGVQSPGVGTTTSIEISEPATVKIEELFKQADVAAVVKILSGDAEHYPQAVYKVEIVTPFKGVKKGDVIFLGPFIGYRIGDEYLAFLQRANEKLVPSTECTNHGVTYGSLPFSYRIMYDGYSFMEIGYECVFDGKEISQQCDDGIKLNTHQVILPKTIRTFPVPGQNADPSDTRWVRKGHLLAHMETLRDNM